MLDSYEILIRLLLAAFLGALIGLERERNDWVAGLRTHMMVSVGSCLIMIVSAFGFEDALSRGSEYISLDPARLAAQVVSGIGFLGAGAILFVRKGAVRGLTTAAGLWTVAAIGLASGGGLYLAAGATTFIAIFILWALKPIELRLSNKFKFLQLKIVTNLDIDTNGIFKEVLDVEDIKIHDFSFKREGNEYMYELRIERLNDKRMQFIISELRLRPEVLEVELY